MTELMEQAKVVEWCRVTDWKAGNTIGIRRVFHIPNGGLRSKSEAARMKVAGVTKGVSDLFIPLPAKGLHGLWVEMKADGGKISPEQQTWLDDMGALGYGAVCAKGHQEAIEAIRAYVGMSDDQ